VNVVQNYLNLVTFSIGGTRRLEGDCHSLTLFDENESISDSFYAIGMLLLFDRVDNVFCFLRKLHNFIVEKYYIGI
jgi:hypothetical protein